MRTWTAHFTPEAWITDEAVETDPAGPQEWDCTEYAMEHQGYLADLPDSGDPLGVLDTFDVFRYDPAAPDWVLEWQGPFTIRVRCRDYA